jgi:hypothetical protein
MVCAREFRSLRWLLPIVVTALLAGLPAAADEDPPQAPPDPTPTAVPGSLAAAAAGIRLQTGAEGDSGALVITDQNLKAVGAGAAVSQGSAATVQPGAQGAAPQSGVAAAPAPANANDLAARLLAQQARVDELATKLQSMDEQLAAPPTDPHYPKIDTAPQFRAPGVIDPARGQRDALAAELEAERGKLEALRAEAAKGGVTITKAPNEAPTPTK